jgi:hypothetical protein
MSAFPVTLFYPADIVKSMRKSLVGQLAILTAPESPLKVRYLPLQFVHFPLRCEARQGKADNRETTKAKTDVLPTQI